jgi:hypothetical protein
MNKQKIRFYFSLTAVLITIFLLVTGSPILSKPLYNSSTIPFGTIITWVGIIALPLSTYWGNNNFRNPNTTFNKYLGNFLKVIILLAFLWVPISYLLAGNLSFSFTEKETFQGGQLAMKWFWRITYGIAISPIVLIIIYWLSLLLKKRLHL